MGHPILCMAIYFLLSYACAFSLVSETGLRGGREHLIFACVWVWNIRFHRGYVSDNFENHVYMCGAEVRYLGRHEKKIKDVLDK